MRIRSTTPWGTAEMMKFFDYADPKRRGHIRAIYLTKASVRFIIAPGPNNDRWDVAVTFPRNFLDGVRVK